MANLVEQCMRERRARRTFVYAMRNERNGYIKIGKARNPVYREKTLQAEEPEITLLFAYHCEASLESELHDVFSSQRLRGEWFALSAHDIDEVRDALILNSTELADGEAVSG